MADEMTCPETQQLLDAYVDAELDVPSVISVESHLSACPKCAGRYGNLQALRREISSAGLDFAPSAEFERKLARRRAVETRPRFWTAPWGGIPVFIAAAAACILLIVIPLRSTRDAASLERQILDNHLRSLAGTQLVDVPSSDRHTVKPWFQGKTPFAPEVPDLSQNGFTLIGGRLDVIAQKRVAVLVYKRREHVINVFISPDLSSGTSRDDAGYHLVSWNQNGMHYTAVSDLNPSELAGFSNLLRSR